MLRIFEHNRKTFAGTQSENSTLNHLIQTVFTVHRVGRYIWSWNWRNLCEVMQCGICDWNNTSPVAARFHSLRLKGVGCLSMLQWRITAVCFLKHCHTHLLCLLLCTAIGWESAPSRTCQICCEAAARRRRGYQLPRWRQPSVGSIWHSPLTSEGICSPPTRAKREDDG